MWCQNVHLTSTSSNEDSINTMTNNTPDKLQMKYHEFYTKMQLLKKRCIEQEIDFSMPVYTHFMKNIKRGKNYYTSYDYDGVFDIDDKNAHIYITL